MIGNNSSRIFIKRRNKVVPCTLYQSVAIQRYFTYFHDTQGDKSLSHFLGKGTYPFPAALKTAI